ncbi:hypothetical protein Tco_0398322 [Tanacetum coccineum]
MFKPPRALKCLAVQCSFFDNQDLASKMGVKAFSKLVFTILTVVAVDRLWEHIPIVGLMVVENKRCGERWIDTHFVIKTVGEGVDEIDKLAELIGEHESDQH